jgi:hypothetical protein
MREGAKSFGPDNWPRCTELVLAGLLVPTGERRQNQPGMSAAVLKVTEAGIRAANQSGGCNE